MAVVSAYQTNTGRARECNEDYVWVDEQAGVYIVADGLGGHEGGDVASRLAATTVGQLIAARVGAEAEPLSTAVIRALMGGAIEATNERVWAAASAAGQDRRMATTIAVALVRPPAAYVSHAGDARAYLARDSTLMRLTEDDSVIAQLIAAGTLSEAEAHHHPQRHLVTKVVGQGSPVEPAFTEVALVPGDWLLLCSDGLWGMVDDDRILAELQQADGDPTRVVEALTEAANAAGGADNISVIAIRVLPPGSKGGS